MSTYAAKLPAKTPFVGFGSCTPWALGFAVCLLTLGVSTGALAIPCEKVLTVKRHDLFLNYVEQAAHNLTRISSRPYLDAASLLDGLVFYDQGVELAKMSVQFDQLSSGRKMAYPDFYEIRDINNQQAIYTVMVLALGQRVYEHHKIVLHQERNSSELSNIVWQALLKAELARCTKDPCHIMALKSELLRSGKFKPLLDFFGTRIEGDGR